MNTAQPKREVSPQEALDILEQAWAYFTPEQEHVELDEQLDLFQYANAA